MAVISTNRASRVVDGGGCFLTSFVVPQCSLLLFGGPCIGTFPQLVAGGGRQKCVCVCVASAVRMKAVARWGHTITPNYAALVLGSG